MSGGNNKRSLYGDELHHDQNKLCGRPPQYAPAPCEKATLTIDLWPFDLENGVRVTCDVGYLFTNFSLSKASLFST